MTGRRLPLVSACIIGRDNADTLDACLASLRPFVDQIVFVDTGSADNTPQIAARYGAEVHHFRWCDDFSAARNESLRHATGDWLFWMDTDDTIDPENGRKLRALAAGPHAENILGYVLQVVCPGERGEEATVVDHIKLIRNSAGLEFEFRIHEQLLPSIRRLGGDVGWTDIFVTHSGSDQSHEGRRKKYERDLRILALELRDRPDHPFANFNAGMTHSDKGDHDQAAYYLKRCLQVAAPEESQVRKAYALLVHSYDQLGRAHDAWQTCEKGLALYPDDPELLFRRAKLAHDASKLEVARDAYRQVLRNGCERHFTSIDTGVLGYKARHNLALVYQDMGREDLAELQWRIALEDVPRFRPAWKLLGSSLVRQRKLISAELLAESMREHDQLALESHLVAAELCLARGSVSEARCILLDAHASQSKSTEALEALCRLEFERGIPEDAAVRLDELIAIRPNDAAAHHNLGAVRLRMGDARGAVDGLSRSLALRPDSPATSELLIAATRLDESGASQPAVHGESQRNGNGALPSRTPDEAAAASDIDTQVRTIVSGPGAATQSPAHSPRAQSLDVAVITVGYNLPGATRTLIESALKKCRHRATFAVFSHSRLTAKQQELEELAGRRDLVLFDYGTNRGLSKSWNEGVLWGFENGHQVVLVVNEDVVFGDGDLTRLVDAAYEQRDKFLVMGRCFHENEDRWSPSEYGCFAVNPPALEILGCFDENFFPIYYEDCDYRRRARLAGLAPGYCDRVSIRHAGSSALKQPAVARQNRLTYAANRAYYMRKWGGENGSETLEKPFSDARFSLFIDPRVRLAPYPGFDRTDQHIVTI
jgi:tetratricopeptide (TPR) repeat protein/GT2 family glycosyltransferase